MVEISFLHRVAALCFRDRTGDFILTFFNTIFFILDSVQEPKGSLGVPMEISSPITSDEEYLSPLEEVMDFGVQEPRQTIDARFRDPPAFLVRPSQAN